MVIGHVYSDLHIYIVPYFWGSYDPSPSISDLPGRSAKQNYVPQQVTSWTDVPQTNRNLFTYLHC